MPELLRQEFLDRLSGIGSSWVHAEFRDSYGVPADLEQVERWRQGDPTHPSYYDFVPMFKDLADRGRILRRVKVVCEPLNDYHRWAYSMVGTVIEAGEATRWLPRHRLEGHLVPATDFYVLDDSAVIYLFFDGDGRVVRRSLVEDPAEAKACSRIFEEFWELSTDHHEYRPD